MRRILAGLSFMAAAGLMFFGGVRAGSANATDISTGIIALWVFSVAILLASGYELCYIAGRAQGYKRGLVRIPSDSDIPLTLDTRYERKGVVALGSPPVGGVAKNSDEEFIVILATYTGEVTARRLKSVPPRTFVPRRIGASVEYSEIPDSVTM